MNNLGRHILADIYTVEKLEDMHLIQICCKAIEASNMNVVSCSFKQFHPQGATAVWILEESHFTLHTYPEHKYLSVDCYTCGDEGRPDLAIQHLISSINVAKKTTKLIERGLVDFVSNV